MSTLNLEEAAVFLHMSPATVGEKARIGQIKGAKPGKRWVFLETDLVHYLDCLYSARGKAPFGGCEQEISQCHLKNAAMSGGLTSQLPMDGEYADLLGLETKR